MFPFFVDASRLPIPLAGDELCRGCAPRDGQTGTYPKAVFSREVSRGYHQSGMERASATASPFAIASSTGVRGTFAKTGRLIFKTLIN